MFGAFRDAVIFQCNVRTRSQAAAPQSDNRLSFQLILQVTGISFSAAQIWNRQSGREKNKQTILKNKIPPPHTAYVLSSIPCVSAALACYGIRDGYPQASASQSGIWLPCSRFRKRRDEMRVHAGDPSGALTTPSCFLPPSSATDAPPTRAQSPAVTSARAVFPNQAQARISDLCKKYNSQNLQKAEWFPWS